MWRRQPGGWRLSADYYCEIGGTGGPEAAAGCDGGAAAVTAGGDEAAAGEGLAAGSDPLPELGADMEEDGASIGGAGIPGATGSDRRVPVTFGGSMLSD